MSKLKIASLSLFAAGSACLLGSFALAAQAPDSERAYPDDVLSRFGEAAHPSRAVDETHALELGANDELVLRTIALDLDLRPGPEAKLRFRSTVDAGNLAPLKIERQGSQLIVSTDESESERDEWSFVWRSDPPGAERGLSLELPAAWSGRVRLETVSGDVEIEGLKLERLEARTVSGDLDFEGEVVELRWESVSGDAELELPAGFGARVEAHSVSGDLASTPPLERRESPGHKGLQGSFGDGRADLRFETVSGDIEIRREGGGT